MLGLPHCTQAFSSCGEQGLLYLWCVDFSLWSPGSGSQASVAEMHGWSLSLTGSRWLWHMGMWDLPGPGVEPVSPALACGFLFTTPQLTCAPCSRSFFEWVSLSPLSTHTHAIRQKEKKKRQVSCMEPPWLQPDQFVGAEALWGSSCLALRTPALSVRGQHFIPRWKLSHSVLFAKWVWAGVQPASQHLHQLVGQGHLERISKVVC